MSNLNQKNHEILLTEIFPLPSQQIVINRFTSEAGVCDPNGCDGSCGREYEF